MTTSVIKQIVKEGEYGTQTIKMVVKSNERGPKGDKGDKGDAATIEAGRAYSVNPDLQPSVMNVGTENHAKFDFYIPKGKKGDKGEDGAIKYTAGTGIKITNNNVIQATGAAVATWGGIEGTITDQTDLVDYVRTAATARQQVWYAYETRRDTSVMPGEITVKVEEGDFRTQARENDLFMIQFGEAWYDINGGAPVIKVYSDYSGSIVFTAEIVAPGWGYDETTQEFHTYNGFIGKGETLVLRIVRTTSSRGTLLALGKERASTSYYGNAKLYDGHDSTSTELAATANALKNVYDAIPPVFEYSWFEKDSGLKWTGDETIYMRTTAFSLQNNASMYGPHNISNLGKIIKIEGFAKNPTTGDQIPIPNNNVIISFDDTNEKITCTDDLIGYSDAHMTIYYTKTPPANNE